MCNFQLLRIHILFCSLSLPTDVAVEDIAGADIATPRAMLKDKDISKLAAVEDVIEVRATACDETKENTAVSNPEADSVTDDNVAVVK